MNVLQEWFETNTGRRVNKWSHYFEVYDRHFSRYRGEKLVIVEFGVSQGGSLDMWREYFGPKCKIYGVDINPHCKQFEQDGIKIFIGDQEDRSFLQEIAAQVGHIDILIDDGGHTMRQQIHTYEELFPLVAENGVYVCEDCHTSYWRKFGGGYKRRGTFMEYSKNFVDSLNAWHSQSRSLPISEFTKTVKSVHFYDSMVVVEKGKVKAPLSLKSGTVSIPNYHPPARWDKRLARFLKAKLNISQS